MTIADADRQTILALLEATNEGRVVWNPKGLSTLEVNVDNDFTVQIWSGEDDGDRAFVSWGLRVPESTQVVGNFSVMEHDVDFELMTTLYRAAQKSAFRLPERMGRLKALLSGKGKVGE